MGDTGALMIGFIMSVLAFRMIGLNAESDVVSIYRPSGIAFAIMIVPLFDTLRVFVLRLSNGQSPFRADNRHLHHSLLQLGFSHRQTCYLLMTLNAVVIALAIVINRWEIHYFLLTILLLAFLFLPAMRWLRRHRAK